MPNTPHRLFASIVVAGMSIAGCSSSHATDAGTDAGADAGRDAGPVTVDAGSDAGCPATCDPCGPPTPGCEMCMPCIL